GAWRDAGLGVAIAPVFMRTIYTICAIATSVTSVTSVTRQCLGLCDEFAAVDLGLHIDGVWIDAKSAFRDQQVGEDNTGALAFVDQIEEFGNGVKSIQRIFGRDDKTFKIALAGSQCLP